MIRICWQVAKGMKLRRSSLFVCVSFGLLGNHGVATQKELQGKLAETVGVEFLQSRFDQTEGVIYNFSTTEIRGSTELQGVLLIQPARHKAYLFSVFRVLES